MGPDRQFVEIRGCRTAYVDVGAGTPLMFIHGWGFSLDYWTDQLEAFGATHRVVAYDLRGMGDSSRGVAPFELADLVADAHALNEHLGLGPAVVCGHSLGAMVASRYAAAHPADIESVVLTAMPPKPERSERRSYHLARAILRGAALAGADNPVAALRRNLEAVWYSPRFRKRHPEVLARQARVLLANRPDDLLNAMKAWIYRRPEPELDMPVLCIVGEEDKAAPPASLEYLKRRHGNFTERVMEGVGHLLCVEDGDAFNAELRAWLSGSSEDAASG